MNKIINKKIFPNIAIILMIAIFFISDRFLKNLALKLDINERHNIIGKIFSFSFAENYNIAFSLPIKGLLLNIVIIAIILAIIFMIAGLAKKQKSFSKESLILTFILFGAISNIIDRVQYGYVIDYLELRYFTIFNLADVMISFGALILILSNLKFVYLCSEETSKIK